MLNKLKGINKEKQIEVRDKTIEKFFQISNNFIEEYKGIREDQIQKDYFSICNKLEKQLNFNYNEINITDFVLTRSIYKEDKQRSLGLFTGYLVHILTQRQNGKCKINIDGKGNKFDYLFLYANNVDEIKVENFEGDYILKQVASFNGKANKIIIDKIKGDFAGSFIGLYKGEIHTIHLSNVKGNDTGEWIGSEGGIINTVLLSNIKGDYSGNWIGGREGKIDSVLLSNIQGDSAGRYVGYHGGEIGTVLLSNIHGDNIGNWIGSEEGEIHTILLSNIKGNCTGHKIASNSGKIKYILINNCTSLSNEIHRTNIIDKQKNPEQYQRLIKELNIDQLIRNTDY